MLKRKILAFTVAVSMIINSYVAMAMSNIDESDSSNNINGLSQIGNSNYIPNSKNIQNNSLSTVYVSDTGTPDASGKDENNPISDLNRAIDLVKPNGIIKINGNITVDDLNFPNKSFIIDGSVPQSDIRNRITFLGDVIFQNLIYLYNLDLEFISSDKDCIFINGSIVNLKNTSILGYPNIYLGSKNENLYDEKSTLTIYNDNKLNMEIENVYLGGYGGKTISTASIELQNVDINGFVDGDNVTDRSYVTIMDNCTIPVIKNILKIIIEDNSSMYITDNIHNVRELYGDKSSITINDKSKIDIDYLYGDIELYFDKNIVKTGNVITCKNIVGDVFISSDLIRQGYRVNKINSNGLVQIAILNQFNENMQTNYPPNIKHPKDLVIVEGSTADIRKGVSAWDFEDGDLTDAIVYPNIDLRTLSAGTHSIIYKVKDKDGNLTESSRTVHVIAKSHPIINGAEDVKLKIGEVDLFNPLDGITVTDNKDTDLTATYSGAVGKPKPGTEESFELIYTVTDSDNNTTSVTRTITVTNYMPEIKGLTDVDIKKGDYFDFMKDVTATDYEDGAVSDIKIENMIDTNIHGKYKMIYLATDTDLNTTKATRNIIVRNSIDWTEITPSKPIKPTITPTIKWNKTTQVVKYTGKEAIVEEPIVEFPNNEKYDYTIKYTYKPVKTQSEFIQGLPTKVGEYEVKATVIATDKYNTATTNTNMILKIEKIKLNPPVISPNGGTVPQQVEITSDNKDADIYYTIDGSDPLNKSIKYTGKINVDKSMVIRAIAVCGDVSSAESTAIFIKDEAEVEFDFDKDDLTEVPDSLKDLGYTDVSQIKNKMYSVLVQQIGDKFNSQNTLTYDVKLRYSLDNGKTWVYATAENFPANGVEVKLEYPKGTTKETHNFRAVHMFTDAVNGFLPGQTETPKVIKDSDGIRFTVNGLSPITITWIDIKNDNQGGDSSGNDDNHNDNSSNNDYDYEYENKQDSFWKDVENKINALNNAGTLKVNAGSFDKLPVSTMNAILSKSNINVIIEWDGGKSIILTPQNALKEENRIYYPLAYLEKLNLTVSKNEANQNYINPTTGGVLEITAPKVSDSINEHVITDVNRGIAENSELAIRGIEKDIVNNIQSEPQKKTVNNILFTVIAMITAITGGVFFIFKKRILKNK